MIERWLGRHDEPMRVGIVGPGNISGAFLGTLPWLSNSG